MKMRSLDHIVLNVSDVEASLQFYEKILGLEPERVEAYQAGEVLFPSVRINEHTIIDLFPSSMWAKENSQEIAELGHMNHFCLVASQEDVLALKEKVLAMGLLIEGPVTRWGARGNGESIYFKDPDGITVEVRYYKGD